LGSINARDGYPLDATAYRSQKENFETAQRVIETRGSKHSMKDANKWMDVATATESEGALRFHGEVW
jgi:hypothetical protein